MSKRLGGRVRVEDSQTENQAAIVPVTGEPEISSARRNLLRMGALTGAAIVTVRPGMAQAAASALKCTISVPDPARSTKWIMPDGTLVAANTKNSFAGPTSPLKATDIQNALTYNASYPGSSQSASSAYTNYIKTLKQGTAGFTCYASIQNPVR